MNGESVALIKAMEAYAQMMKNQNIPVNLVLDAINQVAVKVVKKVNKID